MFGPGLLVAVVALASPVFGQTAWQPNQVNTRICQWLQFGAAVLRDTVYLNGGDLWWEPGFADGSTGPAVTDNNRLGVIYTLNFSTPFNTTQNISAILGTLATGGGDANNRAPNYVDGALLGNDNEFFVYGGLPQKSDAFTPPPGHSVLAYNKYQYGAPKPGFTSYFYNKDLGPNVTRYVAYGGAASAPSENLAWYFSGLRSPSGGEIYYPGTGNATTTASNVSSTLITLDMATQLQETFTNDTLPQAIPGRADPELVWVPVGSKGILVVLGGVVYPDFSERSQTSANQTASELQSPSFMSTIDIYDVASRKWYTQKTTGGPGQRTRGCAVVARAQDGSSFNIYYYGGYDGLHQDQPFSDEVWVLSLPSFTWVLLANSTVEGRAGHKCVAPYPDQMMVIGGYPHPQGLVTSCLTETIRVFNLSAGTWLDRYDPAIYSNYTVPSAVHEKIGGSGTGGATATTPSPSGFDSTELAKVFATPYPVTKIATYYPYPSVGPVNNTNPNVGPTPSAPSSGGGGLPSYLPPVLGVVLGLVFFTMVAVLILLWRRRRLLRAGTASEVGTEYTTPSRAFIKWWLRGQPAQPAQPSEAKAPTVTSSDYTPASSAEPDTLAVAPRPIAEMMDTGVPLPVELPADTSPPAELQGNNNNPLAPAASLNPAALYPTTHQTDHAATTTTTPSPYPTPSPPHPTPPPVPVDNESPVFYRPDSDALGQPLSAGATSTAGTTTATTSPTTPATATATATGTGSAAAAARSTKVLSGISNLSERDRAHLRQISDTTVSSVTTAPSGSVAGNNNGAGGRASYGSAAPLGSDGGGEGGRMRIVVGGADDRGIVESPAAVSPPTAGPVQGGGEFLAAAGRPLVGQGQGQGQQGMGSPLRRSVFSEDISDGEHGSGRG